MSSTSVEVFDPVGGCMPGLVTAAGAPGLVTEDFDAAVLASTGSSMGGLITPPLNLEGLGS